MNDLADFVEAYEQAQTRDGRADLVDFLPPVDQGQNALFDSTGALSDGAGAIDLTTTTSRQLQIALKIIW